MSPTSYRCSTSRYKVYKYFSQHLSPYTSNLVAKRGTEPLSAVADMSPTNYRCSTSRYKVYKYFSQHLSPYTSNLVAKRGTEPLSAVADMSPTSYRCSTSRYKVYKYFSQHLSPVHLKSSCEKRDRTSVRRGGYEPDELPLLYFAMYLFTYCFAIWSAKIRRNTIPAKPF
jgi:hypothetical protein